MTDEENITLEDVTEGSRERSTLPPDTQRNLDVAHEVISNLLEAHLGKLEGLISDLRESIQELTKSINTAVNVSMQANQRSQKNEADVVELKRSTVVQDDTIAHLEERVSSLEEWREMRQGDEGL